VDKKQEADFRTVVVAEIILHQEEKEVVTTQQKSMSMVVSFLEEDNHKDQLTHMIHVAKILS